MRGAEAQAAVEAVAARRDVVLALAALLGRLPPETIAAILRRWGASNELRAALCWIAERMDLWPRAAEMALAEFKRLLASPQFDRLRRLWQHAGVHAPPAGPPAPPGSPAVRGPSPPTASRRGRC